MLKPLVPVVSLIISTFSPYLKAATIEDLTVFLEANHNPVADNIQVDALLSDKEVEAEIEIRGFTVKGERITPIVNKEGKDWITKGKVIREFQPDPVPLVAEHVSTTFWAQYAQIDLPVGDHKIGFEVRLSVGGKVTDVERTALIQLSVTKDPRTHITYTSEDPKTKVLSKVEIELLEPFVGGYYRKKLSGWEDFGMGRVEGYILRPFEPKPLKKSKLEMHRWLHLAGPWEAKDRASVWYATNRHVPNERTLGVSRFTSERGKLRMGSSRVDIPVKTHKMGFLELPDNSEKLVLGSHFRLDDVFSNHDELLKRVSEFQAYETDDILVYVHGFATDYTYGTLRFAQMVHDIRFQGMPIAFLWASQGKVGLESYKTDEITAEKTYQDLADFLVSLHEAYVAGERKGKIHLIAHSMGNRVLLNAIHLARSRFKTPKPFGHVILAAPDLDVSDFVAVAPSAVKLAERVTHYHCDDDKALKISRGIHVNKRVGEAAVLMEGVQNIDARNANTSIIGHDYYVSKSPLLYDLDMLLNRNMTPDDRPTLRRTEDKGHPHWVFP